MLRLLFASVLILQGALKAATEFDKEYDANASEEEQQVVKDKLADAILSAVERAKAEGQRPLVISMLKNKAEGVRTTTWQAEDLQKEFKNRKKARGRKIDEQAIITKINGFWDKNAKKRDAFLDYLRGYYSENSLIAATGKPATLDNITKLHKKVEKKRRISQFFAFLLKNNKNSYSGG